MPGSEFLARALNTGEEFLSRDGDIGLLFLASQAVVAYPAIFCGITLAKICQQRYPAANCTLGVVDHRLQMLGSHLAQGFFFFVDEKAQLLSVSIAVQQQAMSRQPIPPGAPDLLVIAFNAFGQVMVQNKAHIRFIDPHPEGDSGDDDLDIVVDE